LSVEAVIARVLFAVLAAVGLGSNGEHPVTTVRGADGCCWKTIPRRVVPERGQVPENLSPDSSVMESKDGRDVLHEHVPRSKLANGTSHLSPQNGFGVPEPLPLPGARGSLTGESAGDDVDSGNNVSSDVSDVVKDGDAGPSFREDAAAPWVGFAEPGVMEPGLVEAVVEEADPGEKASNGQHGRSDTRSIA
jgi:hypothetical protein